MWMHNGNLGGWKYIKRTLAGSLADKWFLGVKGGTDSEWAFALFLDILEKEEGVDPSSAPEGGFGHEVLRRAMEKTIARINGFVREIRARGEESDLETRSLLNFAVTDGHTVVCTRYVSSKTDEAASLYFSSGTKWVEGKTEGHFKMERHDKGADIVLVASEPLTFERRKMLPFLVLVLIESLANLTNADNWVTVPTNSIVTIHKQTVLIHPIIDEFYDTDPNHDRRQLDPICASSERKPIPEPTLVSKDVNVKMVESIPAPDHRALEPIPVSKDVNVKMVESIPAPDHRALLPPLLACLPAAFASSQPPPALLPLLSPILRQRVQLISTNSWLRTLCWDSAKAEHLERIVENTTFEPHPVSGEIEIPDDIPITYKRFDQETIRSRLPLEDYNIAVVYVWCPGDQQGGGPGWRVTELLPLESVRRDHIPWFNSIAEADERANERNENEQAVNRTTEEQHQEDEDEEDDDDYWAQYDNTPGRTPAQKSPVPQVTHRAMQPTAEDLYFSRYAEVQPALDNDDPSVNRNDMGESTLNGNAVAQLLQHHAENISEQERLESLGIKQATRSEMPHSHPDIGTPLNQPWASSPLSGSISIRKLEQSAEAQSAAEIGVKQHILTNIQSLFRLAKATGMSRLEFKSFVQRELEDLDSLVMGDEA